ncbi:YafY family protein [Parafrankia sp. EUN1f]|uniref:helix-turn-helix transcriptional regulator n=1 Tax=Parafrankia sp. EUN1f TaxID=102897 RepID=UPI0001C450FB|nr:WYL domain-containing protein [Parafrankia sp. EUN1f]EFC85183.1 Helix-turn-helix type 11 domain protein [Parafrankia sp. EUN1f]
MALLLHLQSHGGATAADLAARFEVSVRTVRRDVAALAQAGVPVWSEPGPRGGIRLVEGWRTRLDGLTGDEASALLLAGAGGDALAGLGLDAVAAAARGKVLATLPPQLRVRAGQVGERFHLDAPGWFTDTEPVPCLAAVAAAVWAGHRLDIRYGRPERTDVPDRTDRPDRADRTDRLVRRQVEPLGLVLKAGVWYLVAGQDGDIRSYRVARIAAAEPVPGPRASFTRPADFRLDRWWAASKEDFVRSLHSWPARLALTALGERILAGVLDPLVVRRALATAGVPDADGWRELDVWFEGPEVAESQLWALGPHVRVVAPASLRAALAGSARRSAAINA